MNENVFTLAMGGQAGRGVKGVGLIIAKLATRSGKQVYTYSEYPSLIRGGHNVMQISISKDEVTAPTRKIDLWIALDQKTLNAHIGEFHPQSGIIYDEEKNYDLSKIGKDVILYPIPLARIAKEAGGIELMSNTVAFGAVIALLNGELNILNEIIKDEFSVKGEKIVSVNLQAVKKGYDFALEHFADKKKDILVKEENITPRMIANGNDAAAFGAIAAGLQFTAIYPMSPISNILHVLSLYQEKFGFIYKQPEDEIAAINMAIGASLAGARSMTATSGGGFCLMTEGVGLAGMTETPLVIVNGMRPGPSSGLPTWSAQGDLRMALHASQGDFPRIVLAPGGAEETFYLTMDAFNLADKYQTPVIILIDKNICDNDQSLPIFDYSNYRIERGKIINAKQNNYRRYEITPDGISPRAFPGSGNFFIANSYEHTDEGYDTEEIKDINQQMKKRMTKLEACKKTENITSKLYGPENAELTIVSWGSNKGSIITALKDFSNVNFLHIVWMNPFPAEDVKNILSKSKKILNIECNYEAVLGGLIREKTGIEISDNLLKYDGRPIFPEEIVEKIKTLI